MERHLKSLYLPNIPSVKYEKMEKSYEKIFTKFYIKNFYINKSS
jgi:hypothetical protein